MGGKCSFGLGDRTITRHARVTPVTLITHILSSRKSSTCTFVTNRYRGHYKTVRKQIHWPSISSPPKIYEGLQSNPRVGQVGHPD